MSGILSDCKTDRIQIRLDVLLGLIWVQIVCKGFQQINIGVFSLVVSYDSEIFDIQGVQDSCVGVQDSCVLDFAYLYF